MLSINKIYCWLFVFALLIQIPSIHLLKFLDELLVVFMMCLVFLDVVVNKQFKKYNLLWVITGIMLFYAIYSLTWVSYNTPKAVLYDFIAQMKPFCYFCVSYAVVPKFSNQMKTILRVICIMISIIVLFSVVSGLVEQVLFHPAYVGLLSLLAFCVYLLASIDEHGKVAKKDVVISLILLTIGLTSTRAKFYGEYVFILYLLFFYVPGSLKKMKISHLIIALVSLCLILVVAWNKIDYYFISGGEVDMAFDEDLLSSFARPVMYASMFPILGMHLLFGSGFASFGTYASSTSINYSNLYSVIGIDNVWGLSRDFDSFICDAYYPSLAQYGLIGLVLFIVLYVWMYKKLSLYIYITGKVYYLIGLVIIVALLIENIAATSFNQGAGAMCMMILGYLISNFKKITKEQEIEIRKMPYKESGALEYIKK